MANALAYANQYRETEIRTVDSFGLVLLLYKGALDKLRLAKAAIESGHIEGRVSALNGALAIIGELQAALDMKNGKHIAASLNSLYSYVNARLAGVVISPNTETVDEVIRLLTVLESAWQEARVKATVRKGDE